jgi:hypothetical protein
MSDSSLNSAYHNARFRADLPASGISQAFCIVTACYPFDEKVTAEENVRLTGELKNDLELAELVHFPVTGYDTSPDHREPGFGIICDRVKAIAFGQKFRQNAIFSVYDNTVHLISCEPPHKDIPIGKWTDLLSS